MIGCTNQRGASPTAAGSSPKPSPWDRGHLLHHTLGVVPASTPGSGGTIDAASTITTVRRTREGARAAAIWTVRVVIGRLASKFHESSLADRTLCEHWWAPGHSASDTNTVANPRQRWEHHPPHHATSPEDVRSAATAAAVPRGSASVALPAARSQPDTPGVGGTWLSSTPSPGGIAHRQSNEKPASTHHDRLPRTEPADGKSESFRGKPRCRSGDRSDCRS